MNIPTRKEVHVKTQIRSILMNELNITEDAAFKTAEACIALAHRGGEPKVGVFDNLFFVLTSIYKFLRFKVMVLAILATVTFGAKYVFYDNAHWFYRYPKVATRLEIWRPVETEWKDKYPKEWSKAYDKTTGQCLEAEVKSCIHGYVINGLREALETAVKEGKQGVIWQGNTGMGEIWTIEHKDIRFIITRQKDLEFND